MMTMMSDWCYTADGQHVYTRWIVERDWILFVQQSGWNGTYRRLPSWIRKVFLCFVCFVFFFFLSFFLSFCLIFFAIFCPLTTWLLDRDCAPHASFLYFSSEKFQVWRRRQRYYKVALYYSWMISLWKINASPSSSYRKRAGPKSIDIGIHSVKNRYKENRISFQSFRSHVTIILWPSNVNL